MGLLIFSDLDGTLLDHHTYSHAEASPALAEIARRGAALVLCSSKTRAEMLPLWQELGLGSPFIAENGGGIFAPSEHFAAQGWESAGRGWRVHRLGEPVEEVRRRAAGLMAGFRARGFGDMTDAEVSGLTGLSLGQAALARKREFNEPVLLQGPEGNGDAFMKAAARAGLAATRGGRFFHLLGGGGKGKAVKLLSGLYREKTPGLVTMGLGDSLNDLSMLKAVDLPVQVARHDGSHAELGLPPSALEPLPGPKGWNRSVLAALARQGES